MGKFFADTSRSHLEDVNQKWGTVMTSTRTWNRTRRNRTWKFEIPFAGLPTARRNRKFLSTGDSSSEDGLLSKLFPVNLATLITLLMTFTRQTPSESRITLGFNSDSHSFHVKLAQLSLACYRANLCVVSARASGVRSELFAESIY